RGTYNLLEACRRNAKLIGRVVVASSDKAYGDQPVLPYTEDSPLEGRFPYDASKSITDLITRSYFETYAVPACTTRCGNLFGPGDLNWNRIVPGTIRSVIRGERPVIRSDGLFTRDYLYVEDGARAYLRLAEQLAATPALAGEVFNFSYEHPMTVLELVARILEVMGSDLEPDVRNEASNEIRDQYLDASKARTMLGWAPAFSLDAGLRATVAWYQEYFR